MFRYIEYNDKNDKNKKDSNEIMKMSVAPTVMIMVRKILGNRK